MDRQKMIMIFGGAWVSAILLTWFLYAKTVAPQEERQVKVAVATHDMPLGTLLRAGDVKLVNYPERNIPKGVVFQSKDAVGRVALSSVSSNEPILISKLSAPTAVEGFSSVIEPGYRAVSVQITDVSGVAGLIQPNSHVDVLFTRPGTIAEAATTLILQDVKVLSTGKILPAGQTADSRTPKSPVVTLLLRPDDAQKLELAKNQGRIGLSLRNPLDNSHTDADGPVTAEVLDPTIDTRLAARKRAGHTNEDDPLVQELKAQRAKLEAMKLEEERRKKEAEKPRVIVDVYRGDKHVQEAFR